MQRDLLELAGDGVIALGQERMKILKHEDGRLDLFNDVIQCCERLLGGGVTILLGLNGSSSGHDAGAVTPLENFLLSLARDVSDDFLNPQLFTRDDVKNRIPRADQRLDLGWEIHLQRTCPLFISVSTSVPTRSLRAAAGSG